MIEGRRMEVWGCWYRKGRYGIAEDGERDDEGKAHRERRIRLVSHIFNGEVEREEKFERG